MTVLDLEKQCFASICITKFSSGMNETGSELLPFGTTNLGKPPISQKCFVQKLHCKALWEHWSCKNFICTKGVLRQTWTFCYIGEVAIVLTPAQSKNS